MGRFLLFCLFVVGVCFASSLGTYIWARILLPDTGLTVPDYAKFFWAFLIPSPIFIVLGFINDAMKD